MKSPLCIRGSSMLSRAQDKGQDKGQDKEQRVEQRLLIITSLRFGLNVIKNH